MQQLPSHSYLESHVLTASPQKLRLMLIDAAISSARRTLNHWQDDENEKALETLAHCRSIISELLSGVQRNNSELNRRIEGVYLFLFQSLAQAQLLRDRKMVEDAIEVLLVERETWQLVCEKMSKAPVQTDAESGRQQEIVSSAPSTDDNSTSRPGGFVSEA